MKLFALLVCVAALAVGNGCVTSQKNDVVKRNHIVVKNADGSSTEDFSVLEDKSRGFALAGTQSANRRYWNDAPVGTEAHVPRPPVIVAPSYGSYGYGGGYGYGSYGYNSYGYGGYGGTYNASPTGSRYGYYGGHHNPSYGPAIGHRYGY